MHKNLVNRLTPVILLGMSERVLGYPVPDNVVDRFENVMPEDIDDEIKVLGVDVDGVLTFFHDDWLNGMIRRSLQRNAEARKVCLITNSYGEREKSLPSIFKGVSLELIVTPGTVALPDENPKKHRKPNPDMITHAVEELGIQPQEFMMFDDQLSAGGEAAARAGAKMTLVPRLGRLDHLGVRIFRRGPEAMARAAMGIPFHKADFPTRLTSVEVWREMTPEERAKLRA